MRMSLTLCVMMLAGALSAELNAQSENGGLDKPGDCTKEEYRRLNAVVGSACKAAPSRCERCVNFIRLKCREREEANEACND